MPTGSESRIQVVCIRIRVTDLPQAQASLLPSDRRSPHHLYLIEGTFEDIIRYSGPTQSSSTKFREHLNERDGNVCAVTGDLLSPRASHLIPKCLGTEGANDIVNRFVSAAEVMGIHPRIHKYHASIGILLHIGLDSLVDTFQAGFYHDTNNTYMLHNFCNVPTASVHGASSAMGDSLLHGYSATLQVRAGEHHLPPPGVFNWHYIQCVIKKFGIPEYTAVSDIRFFIHPFRTVLDTSESESGDSSTKPPYPSNPLARRMESHWALERKEAVLEWASGVPSASGICVPGSTVSE